MNRLKPILLLTVGVALLLAASVAAAQTDPEPVDPTAAPAADMVDPLAGDAPDTPDPLTGDAPDATTVGEGEGADEVTPAEGDAPDQVEPADTSVPGLDPDTDVAPTTEPTTEPTGSLEPADATTVEVLEAESGGESGDEAGPFCRPTYHPEVLAPPGPVALVLTPEDFAGDLTIEWEPSPHQEPAGGPVSHYRAEYREGDGEWQELESEVFRDVRRATLEGADADGTYGFRVYAVSFILKGETIESEPAVLESVTVRELPSVLAPPTNLTLVRSLEDFDGTITIGWDLSADDGVRLASVVSESSDDCESQNEVDSEELSGDDHECLFAVKEYRASARAEGESDWIDFGPISAGVRIAKFDDAELGIDYQFRVVAVTGTRGGQVSESTPLVNEELWAIRQLPQTIAQPTNFRRTTTPGDLANWIGLAWAPSVDDDNACGARAVSHYRVEYREGTDGEWVHSSDVLAAARMDEPPEELTAIVQRVRFGVDYYFRLQAISASDPENTEFRVRVGGDDPFEQTRVFSQSVSIGPHQRRYTPPEIAPPTDVTATDVPDDAGGTINVQWSPSADAGGDEPTVARYQIEYRVEVVEGDGTEETGDEVAEDAWQEAGEASGGTSFAFTAAEPNSRYFFRVRAATVFTRIGYVAGDWVEVDGVVSEAEIFAVREDPEEPDDEAVVLAATNIEADDVSWDAGGHAHVSWTPPEDDVGQGQCRIETYTIYARDTDGGFFKEVHSVNLEEIETVAYDEEGEVDGLEVEDGRVMATVSGVDAHKTYVFKVVSNSPAGTWTSDETKAVRPGVNWFNGAKAWVFLLGAIICLAILFFIRSARKGKDLFIRKMAGLDAVDEAIGRATEMGRPILFVPGIMDLDNVQTLAGLTILGHTAKMVAEYDTRLDVPVSRSLVLTAGREVIKQAYLAAGRPDAYSEDMVHYLTDAQFGYVAGVNGIIVRDEPATCFYMGAFYAESLILAETGNAAGAIQIAGTAMPSQLPFFVAACDYTLIGEELFAASAYLSQDPKQLGSLKGQDVGKGIAMVFILLGSLVATFGIDFALEFLGSIFR